MNKQSETLARSEKELQALSGRLLSMEQEVRQHVARDLQDEFSQRITTLVWELSALEQRTEVDAGFIAKLHEVKQRISHMGVDLHHLGQRLHSGFLEHCELHVAMKEYIDELNMFARPQIAFEAPTGSGGLSAGSGGRLFRIMQEALANAAKHAEAGAVTVALARTDRRTCADRSRYGKRVRLRTPVARRPAGFGLIIMRERMRAIGRAICDREPPWRGNDGDGCPCSAWGRLVRRVSREKAYGDPHQPAFSGRLAESVSYFKNAVRSLIRNSSATSGRPWWWQAASRRAASPAQYSPKSMTSPRR